MGKGNLIGKGFSIFIPHYGGYNPRRPVGSFARRQRAAREMQAHAPLGIFEGLSKGGKISAKRERGGENVLRAI